MHARFVFHNELLYYCELLLGSASTDYAADQSKALVKFSKQWSIDQAYQHLASSVERVVMKTGDLAQLQRACVRKIKGLDSNLPHKLIPLITSSSSVNGLLDTLTQSEYWNWFDTRLLEAVIHASGSSKAIELLDEFRKIYYQRKVSELVLYNVEIKPFKNFVTLVEKYDKDPSKLTVSDLQKHQYELEKMLEGGLVLLTIKTGCVELTWQVPQELVYQTYTSMKRKHDELSSLAVKSLVCEVADEYAGLPVLWRGQEVGEVGPIEPLPEHVRQEPYSLPQGFQWVTLNSSDVDEVVKFITHCRQIVDSTKVYMHITHPHTRSEWKFGIRTTNGKLVGVVLALPVCMSIGGVSVMCVCPSVVFHKKYNNKRLLYMLNKELQRRANLNNVNQFLYMGSHTLLKPVTTIRYWNYYFTHPTSAQLPNSPRIPGWRKMRSEDAPSALALVNKYSSQFEIRQVFTSEEEFSHHFLYPALPNHVLTYVVENDTNITDLVTYSTEVHDPSLGAFISTVISTHFPIKQLIIAAMVCAKDNGAERVAIRQQHNISNNILQSLSFHPVLIKDCCFYNYKYHEIPGSNFYHLLP